MFPEFFTFAVSARRKADLISEEGTMNKMIAMTLTLLMILGTASAVYSETTTTTTTTTPVGEPTIEAVSWPAYTDLPRTHWAYDSVERMTKDEIIAGYPDGTFRPDATVTYGEFIKMVTSMTKVNGKYMKAASNENWAQNYYESGLNCFYYNRYDITQAQLDQPITRSDMALILANTMKDKTTPSLDEYSQILSKITDVDTTTKNETAITKAYKTGVLSGYPDGTFRPGAYLNRAEAASAILRDEAFADIQEKTEADEPLVEVESVAHSEALCIIAVRNYGVVLDDAHKADLLQALKTQIPAYAQKICDAAVLFAAKDLKGHDIETRKQYIGDYPVLMLHTAINGNGFLEIDVLPIGSCDNNEYWDTKKDEINDSY